MFDNFTFGAQAQNREQLHDEYQQHPSPRDTSLPSPSPAQSTARPSDSQLRKPSQAGLTDLVNGLSSSNLTHEDKAISYLYSLPSPPMEVDDDDFEVEQQYSYISTQNQSPPTTPSLRPTTSKQKADSMCCRLQRQLNVKLQSCQTHVRDINTLVTQMITTNSQCTLSKPTPKPIITSQSPLQPYLSTPPPSRDRTFQPLPTPTPSTQYYTQNLLEDFHMEVDTSPSALEEDTLGLQVDEDEGFCDGEWAPNVVEEEMEMSLRRASAPLGIRKNGLVRFRGVAEMTGSVKGKVYCKPRMRKRIVPR